MMIHASPPMFPTRSRLATARDIAVITVCLALMLGFLAQVWRAPSTASPGPIPSALQAQGA